MTPRASLALVIAAVVLFLGILDVGYEGRAAQRHSSLVGCQRGVRDRHDNAEGWYGAYLARVKNQDHDAFHSVLWYSDGKAAADYLADAKDLNSRTNRWHSVTWPRNSQQHPIGYGKLNCLQAFPAPPFISLG